MAGWFFAIAGAIYALAALTTGHLWRNLFAAPTVVLSLVAALYLYFSFWIG